MVDKDSYDLGWGEWREVGDEYVKVEGEGLGEYLKVDGG